MPPIWIIVNTSSHRIGHSLSGFDSASPTRGRVRWNDGGEEDVKLSSLLRKCLLRSFEHYRYEYYPEFKLQLENDLGGLLVYWLASKQLSKKHYENLEQSQFPISASYSAGKDFITVLNGLNVEYDSNKITPKQINKVLDDLTETGTVRIVNEKPKIYEYCGSTPIKGLWPGLEVGYQRSENFTKEILEKQIASYFYAAETMGFEDLRINTRRESSPLPIVDYALSLWSETEFQNYTKKFLENDQLEFLNQFSTLFRLMSSHIGNDTHKKKIAEKLMKPLLDDFFMRPVSAGIYPSLSKALMRYSQKVFDKDRNPYELKFGDDAEIADKFNEVKVIETQVRLLEGGLHSKFSSDLIESLACIEIMRLKTKHLPQLSHLDFQDLQKLYLTVDEKVSHFEELGVSVSELKTLIEGALLTKLKVAEPSMLEVSPIFEFLERISNRGILPETFSGDVFLSVAQKSKKLAERPNWWRDLSLRQTISFVSDNPWLKDLFISMERQHSLITAKIPSHLSSSTKLSDLIVLLQASDWLEIDSASDLKQLWVKLHSKSPLLLNLGQSISEEPVNKARLELQDKYDNELRQKKSIYDVSLQQIDKLSAEIKSLEEALKRGQEDADSIRSGLEVSISRKYASGIAKIIRRLERETGKKPFSEIIAREAAGLLRLGIELLPAGEIQPFSPSIHDSAGQVIQKNAQIVILETGVVLLFGEDRISLLKAVVKPAS
jgi:flagellar motility protein MotE (MotC chaperone)